MKKFLLYTSTLRSSHSFKWQTMPGTQYVFVLR